MPQGERPVVLAEPRTVRGVPAAGGVLRRALLPRLDGVLASRFGLVVGQPGAGKTTVMRQWARAVGLPVVWARCTRAGVVVRATGGGPCVTPDELGRWLTGGDVDGTAGSGGHVGPGGLSSAGDAAGPGAGTLLVLDDAHELIGRPAERDLERLLLDVLPSVHVLVGSRVRPTFNLARSEISSPVVLTGADLRLRPWEVDRLFRDVYDEPLTPEDVATVVHETDGWAVAVDLFHRATAGLLPADRRRAVRGLPADSWYAHDYLAGEILAGLDRPLVELLQWGAAFERMTAARCDALTGTTGSREMLRDLEVRWSLAATDDGVHYTVPRVLRRHLLTVQAEHLGSAAHAWHRRAAHVLEDEGAPAEALDAYRRAGDEADVSRLRSAGHGGGRHAAQPDLFGAVGTPDGRGERAPDPGREDGRAADPREDGRPTRGASQGGGRDDVGADGARDPSDRAGGGWQRVVRDALRRDPGTAATRASRLDAADRDLAEGLCLLLAGDQRAARDPLRRAAQDPDAAVGVTLGATLLDATLTGSSRTAMLTTVDRVQVEADRRGLTWLARLAHGVVVALDGTGRARADVAAHVAYCDRLGDPWGAALVASWSGLVALGQGLGDPQEWDAIVRRWHALDAAVPAVWARACHALAAAGQQLPDAVQDARAAEAFARAAGVPGALALAYAALASALDGSDDAVAGGHDAGRGGPRDGSAAGHDDGRGGPLDGAAGGHDDGQGGPCDDEQSGGDEIAELLGLARSTATEHGLDLRRLRLTTRGRAARPTTSAAAAAPTAPIPVVQSLSASPLPAPPPPTSNPGGSSPSGPGPAGPGPGALAAGESAGLPPSFAPSTTPPALDVQCLGEFRLRVDGVAVDLSGVRPRARSALRFLALHAGRPVHREQLADALWPDLDPTAAMHNLHVSISSVRRALEPSVPTRSSRLIVREGETYTLVLGPGSVCDHVEFDRATKDATRRRAHGDDAGAALRWRAALDLYAGDLLPEEGPADWVVGPRDRVRALAAEAAADLAQVELDRGRHEAAVTAATRSIELDECRDHSWRLLIAALTAAGDTAAAHRAHRGYAAMLDGLGVPVAGRGAVPTVPPTGTADPRVAPGAAASADGVRELVTSGRGTPPPRWPRASGGSPGRSR